MTRTWTALVAALALVGCAGGPPPAARVARPVPLAELPALVNHWQAGDDAPIDTGSLGGSAAGAPVRWDSRAAGRWAAGQGAAFAAPDGSFEVTLQPGMRRGPESGSADGYQVSFDFTGAPAFCRYEIDRVDTGRRRIDNALLMSLLVASYRVDFSDLELFYVGLSEVDGEDIHVVLAGFGGSIRAEAAHAVGDRVFHSLCAVDSAWVSRQRAANALPAFLGELVVAATAVRFPLLPRGPAIRI